MADGALHPAAAEVLEAAHAPDLISERKMEPTTCVLCTGGPEGGARTRGDQKHPVNKEVASSHFPGLPTFSPREVGTAQSQAGWV